jgi:RNA polymerase sigma-70 factor (ECF subfamily)
MAPNPNHRPNPAAPDAGPASDASLLRRYRRGEQDAATELYLRYAGRLRILADTRASPELKQRVDPEDIVQSVFRTFFRRADVGQYDAPTGDELWKLFLVIGLNKIRKVAAFHKAAKRDVRQTAVGPGFDQAVAVSAGSDSEALHTLQLTIDELLAPLSESHRAIINLRAAGHEVAEIAARTGRSRRSVERILHDFRHRLHGLLHDTD